MGGIKTERTRKLLYLPLAYHAAILIALAFMTALQKNTASYGLLMLLDLCGVVVSPMFMALMAISHAILHEGSVFDYLKQGCLYLAIIALLRIALYAWQAPEQTLFAVLCGAAGVGIFLLWEVIFHFTNKLMNKPRGSGKSKRKR